MADTNTLKKYIAPSAIPSKDNSVLQYWYNNIASPAVRDAGTKLANAGKGVVDFVKANPWETAGYGITGAMNIGGLFDNDKIGGQLGGAALGTGLGFLPQLLQAAPLDPKYKVLLGMTGGALGSLFDKLRAEKEQQAEQQQALQQYLTNNGGGYNG